jgi:biopolymer transport protein ExbB/TolQ
MSFGIQEAFSTWYGSAVMLTIISMSIYLMAMIVVRYSFFRKMRVDSDKLFKNTQEAFLKNDERVLSELKGQRLTDPPQRILVGYAMSNTHLAAEELSELLSVVRTRQRERLTHGLSLFGTFAAIAPFVGLLGTVLGIVDCFHSLSISGAAGPNVVASGVAEALWATAAGLVVAIPSVVAYNVFSGKAKRMMAEMEIMSRELLLMLKVDKKHNVRLMGLKEA